jgi:hypothetical protein
MGFFFIFPPYYFKIEIIPVTPGLVSEHLTAICCPGEMLNSNIELAGITKLVVLLVAVTANAT